MKFIVLLLLVSYSYSQDKEPEPLLFNFETNDGITKTNSSLDPSYFKTEMDTETETNKTLFLNCTH